jgi:hypothetical protein
MTWSKRAAIAAVLSFLPCSVQAGDIGTPVSHDFSGWTTHQVAQGDLNGDGNPDAAIILSKPAEGDDENGQALLVVYLDDGQGNYKLHTEAPKAICVGCGGPKAAMGEPLGELSIVKGQLHVTYEGGSREAFSDELKWRLDKDQKNFVLIGETHQVTDTAGEEPDKTLDINFLAMKAEVTVGKKRIFCTVPPDVAAIDLAGFDYDGKHLDDLEKISGACSKR